MSNQRLLISEAVHALSEVKSEFKDYKMTKQQADKYLGKKDFVAIMQQTKTGEFEIVTNRGAVAGLIRKGYEIVDILKGK